MNKPKRTYVQLGEYYQDLLILDSWINARALSNQAGSLLCAKLQEREPRIKERLKYLADKRGCSTEELIKQILNGEIVEDEEE
jgi:hypothetical protein